MLGLVVRQPQLQHGQQALAARLHGHLPDAPEHLLDLRAILVWSPLAHLRVSATAHAGAQQLDSVFAVVSKLLTQLVDHARAALPPTVDIPLPQARQHLFPDFFGSWTWAWVAGVIFFESTSFLPPPSFYPQGVKTYEATGFRDAPCCKSGQNEFCTAC